MIGLYAVGTAVDCGYDYYYSASWNVELVAAAVVVLLLFVQPAGQVRIESDCEPLWDSW